MERGRCLPAVNGRKGSVSDPHTVTDSPLSSLNVEDKP